MPLAARTCVLRHCMHVLTFSEDSEQSVDRVFVTEWRENKRICKLTPRVYNRFCFSLNKHENFQRRAKLRCHVAALTFSSVQAEASCRSASYRQRGNDIIRSWITPALTMMIIVKDKKGGRGRMQLTWHSPCLPAFQQSLRWNLHEEEQCYLNSTILHSVIWPAGGHQIRLQKDEKNEWLSRQKRAIQFKSLQTGSIYFVGSKPLLKINHCHNEKTLQPMGEVTTLLSTQSITSDSELVTHQFCLWQNSCFIVNPKYKQQNACAVSLTSEGSQQHLLVKWHGALVVASQHVPHCLIDGKSGEGVRHLVGGRREKRMGREERWRFNNGPTKT